MRLRASTVTLHAPEDVAFLGAQDLLDELCEDQLILSMDLACLEEAVRRSSQRVVARAAVRTLEARIADLGALRDALAYVHRAVSDPRLQRLAVPDSAFSDYMRGLYAWGQAVVRAFETLAESLQTLQFDWAQLRWRLDEAKNFHFDELHDAIRSDVQALANGAAALGAEVPAIDELRYAIERLFSTAAAFDEHLGERFR